MLFTASGITRTHNCIRPPVTEWNGQEKSFVKMGFGPLLLMNFYTYLVPKDHDNSKLQGVLRSDGQESYCSAILRIESIATTVTQKSSSVKTMSTPRMSEIDRRMTGSRRMRLHAGRILSDLFLSCTSDDVQRICFARQLKQTRLGKL